jgi:4-hydroxybenzoate polyprenyltransferase
MRLLPYAQLLRLPNVFTAFADILLGTLATGVWFSRPVPAALLLLASGCLYCAGMVWNDYFDLEIDKKERPFRPLPSGKISTRTAAGLGLGLLAGGIAFAGAASLSALVIALILAIAIMLYDGMLKATPIGPVNMGLCRFLNVLLALSLVDSTAFPWLQRYHLAGVVGLYIVGVTWFSRGEAGRSNPNHLRGAAALLLGALLLALAVAVHRPPDTVTVAYPYLIVGFGFLIGIPIFVAITRPEPNNVQSAVKRCILGLVVLDAILATAFVGLYGLLIVLLLVPALMLGKKVYST